MSLVQHEMSLNGVSCFQHEMSLERQRRGRRSSEHGDRHAGRATRQHRGSGTVSGGHGRGRASRGGRRVRATGACSAGPRAVRLCRFIASRQGRGSALPAAHQRLFAPASGAPDRPILGPCPAAPAPRRWRVFTAAAPRPTLLMAHTDALHDTPSGLAAKRLFQRAWQLYGDAGYERLAGISVAHLYNLRATPRYQVARVSWQGTRAGKAVSIGVRRAPRPETRGPRGLHPDRQRAPRRSGRHQGRVSHECRRLRDAVGSGGGPRPRMARSCASSWGYSHIPQRFAAPMISFCDYLNPYLNLHRSCLFAEESTDAKGKVVKRDPPCCTSRGTTGNTSTTTTHRA